MGLAESQRLLARLCTDAPLRARFAADPAGVASEFGLSPADADGIAGLEAGQLDEFARSLVGKRLRAVESLLPSTRRVLGASRFADLFRRHARNYLPPGIRKHHDDAVAFGRWLAGELADPSWLGDVCRLEAAALMVHDPGRRWSMVRLGHHPVDLSRAVDDGGPPPRSRPAVVAWFRASPGAKLHRLLLARPW